MLARERIAGIVLAAGKGTRMQSTTPKLLHKIKGKYIVTHVIDSLLPAVDELCLIVDQQRPAFTEICAKITKPWALCTQDLPNGTAGAVAVSGFALSSPPSLPSYALGKHLAGSKLTAEWALICLGDTPGISRESLADFSLKAQQSCAELTVMAIKLPNPTGYGRLILHGDRVSQIVEEQDTDANEKAITLCNTGIFFAHLPTLFTLLQDITQENNQQEYYLTDCIKLAVAKGLAVNYHLAPNFQEFQGVNSPQELSTLSQYMQQRT